MGKTIYLILCLTLFFATPLFGDVGTENKLATEANLIATQLYSFSLEDLLFNLKDNYKSKDDVYKFFRQGFGSSISMKLTENIWADGQVKLKYGDNIMEPSKDVQFKDITKDSAIISFRTPENRKHIWGNAKFTELVFKKEDGRLKLFQK